MSAILEVSDLHVGYGAVKVVHGVSLLVAQGSVTALIGGNGAGKTTIMKALIGSLSQSAGTIVYKSQNIGSLRPHERVNLGLALVPEGRLIFPQLTVEENLRIGGIVPRAQSCKGKRHEEIYELFPRLHQRRAQKGGTLSGGEQQMLALGRALMSAPDLLLLDEPTLGLAPLMADTLFAAIEALQRGGMTILIAEQDTPRTLALADRAYVIENGKVAFDGAGKELLDDPRVREAYLGISEQPSPIQHNP
ncbi:ABC transporter ATP-binding protein [Pusillimonas caeni]|uniref:ABC transporter ATP-binding protein n=1 Tax=Pusillimonas caeni TaxID=1348472 RepID=UPI000E59BBC2|nr:ABC transporter ATP-binding protein [Pusillimonas caeni]TFL15534.1 ABC transporter ATP-binding protein [Pusillimonas caeni]